MKVSRYRTGRDEDYDADRVYNEVERGFPGKSLKTKYGGVPVSTGVCNVCGSEPRPRASLKAGKTITANNELALAA